MSALSVGILPLRCDWLTVVAVVTPGLQSKTPLLDRQIEIRKIVCWVTACTQREPPARTGSGTGRAATTSRQGRARCSRAAWRARAASSRPPLTPLAAVWSPRRLTKPSRSVQMPYCHSALEDPHSASVGSLRQVGSYMSECYATVRSCASITLGCICADVEGG